MMFNDRNTNCLPGRAYNQLNLPEEITFENGNGIKYYYDAAGTKWRKVVTAGSDTSTTDYVGSLILENDTLKTIQTAEGRIVADTAGQGYTYRFQYYLKDHLGNVRVTFGVEPDTTTWTATMESERAAEEEAEFENISGYRQISTQFNHTAGGVANPNESVMLNSTQTVNGTPRTTAAMKRLRVQAGDSVRMEVWAKHLGTSQSSQISAQAFLFSALTAGFGLVATGETALAYDAFNHVFGLTLLHGQNQGDIPAAYLNYIFFNDEYDTSQLKRRMSYRQITSAAEGSFEQLTLDFTAPESGYLYVYISNESNLDVNVYFDDLKITQTSNLTIVQADDYYPFGLAFNSYNDTTESKQKFLYNGKELQTDLNLDWYDYGARMYDAAIGRFMVQDAFAEKYYGLTPYNYTANNPISMIDINGDSITVNVVKGGGKKGRDIYQINVTGKVVDDTKKGLSAKKLNKIARKVGKQIRKSFKGKDRNIEFETTTDITVADANNNPLEAGDHAFRIVDDVATTIGQTDLPGENTAGFALPGQNVVYIEKGVSYGRVGAHELGHSATLGHPKDEINPATGAKYTTRELATQFRGNLMHQSRDPASGTRINVNQVRKIKQMYSIGALNRGKQKK